MVLLTNFDVHWPALVLSSLPNFGDGVGQIRGERAIDVGLQSVEVNLNQSVIVAPLISSKQLLLHLAGIGSNVATVGGFKIAFHAVVEWEDRGGGANLCTHVADGAHASAGDGIHSRTVVLYNGPSATLDGQDVGHFQDDILGRGPSSQGSGQLDSNHLESIQMMMS